MKKILLSFVVLVLAGSLTYSQTAAGKFELVSGGHAQVVYKMTPFAPWASDSSVSATTGTFNVADFDSIAVYVATSSNGASGKVNFSGALLLGQDIKIPSNTTSITGTAFLTEANSLDSVAVAIDTASTKLKVLKYCGTYLTRGATLAAFRLNANLLSSTVANGTKSVVVIFVSGKKHGYQSTY